MPNPNSSMDERILESRLKVFLCHSSSDKPAVRELYKHLDAEGILPWLDEENILPGQDWDKEIRNAVRTADVILVCLSQGSITKSGYVQKEIRYALDVADEQPEGAIFVIPTRLDECEVPRRLTGWQWVNLFEERGFERLIRALHTRAKVLGKPNNQGSQKGPGITIDTGRRQVWIDGRLISSPLSRLEFALLEYLARHTGRVCRWDDIVQNIYNTEHYYFGDDIDRLSNVLRRLRSSLGESARNPHYLVTHRSVGLQLTQGRIIE